MMQMLRLFLVEDDDNIALLMRRSLERAGHQVTRCRTAADALTGARVISEAARINNPFFIFLPSAGDKCNLHATTQLIIHQ